MAEFVALRIEIALIMGICFRANRQLFDDLQPVSLQTHHLFRIIGKKANLANTEIMENLSTHPVVAEVGRETQFFVGLYSIEAFLLEFICVNFCREANAPALLAEVEEHAAVLSDPLKSGVELTSTVTAAGGENISGEAFGVDPDKNGLFRFDFPPREGEMMGFVGPDPVEMAIEGAVFSGQIDGFLACHEAFGPPPVFNNLGDCAGLEAMEALVGAQITDTGHGAIFMHYFAENPRFGKLGHPGKINRGLRVTGPAQDSIISRLQRKDMTWLNEGVRTGVLIGEKADCE